MKKLIMKSILLILITILSGNLFAGENPKDTLKQTNNDTVCFKYSFIPGDTIKYKVISFDSIIIDYGKPLLKIREETIQLVCDSINSNGRFCLNQKLIEYFSRESNADTSNVERQTHPWLGRTARYEIDSLGNRFSYSVDDSLDACLAPGGAFQPHLLIPFQKNCSKINSSWIVESKDDLPENGFPVPLIRQTSLFRAMEPKDTLNYDCNRFQFIKTSQGNYKVKTEEDTIQVTSIINGYGIMFIGKTRNIPIHFLCTIEQKLTLHFKNNIDKPGWHYINSFFSLLDYKEGVKISKPVNSTNKKYKKKYK
jgi:hypothetical protein